MKLKDIDKTEAWSGSTPLGVGWHDVTIESATEGTTSNDNPQIELDYANADGSSIREWVVVIPKTYGKLKALLEAANVDVKEGEWDFNPKELVGRKLGIYVGEEPDFKDPSQMRLRVQAHRLVGESDIPADTAGMNGPTPAADDDELPF